MIVASFAFLQSQIDTVGVYYLTDGGGDPTIKSAQVYAKDVTFTDYTRVGVTPSSGSGFFVSKGFPFGGADYDDGKYHTFTITPQNGATLYLKKFSMNHKRSGSNPNPGNTVNFKCVVSYGGNEYIFGSGTTLNPTAWFYADNLKILTKEPVTIKLYAKDLYDASQSWMQRRVSVIGASIPNGVDPEEIIGPLEPTYTETARDYINPLTFFKINAVGQLSNPLVYDMSGMPLSYEFLLNNEADLSNVSFDYQLPAGTTLEAPLPKDFSTTAKQTVVLKSSWGTRKAVITVRKIKSANEDLNLKFDATNGTDKWNNSVLGWIASGISSAENTLVQFDKENTLFVTAVSQPKSFLSFDINLVESTAFSGVFSVETSLDGVNWSYLKHFNNCAQISQAITNYAIQLQEGVKYVRFIYDCQNSRQKVNLNNILLGTPTSIDSNRFKNSVRIFPNPATKYFSLENAFEIDEVTILSATGATLKRFEKPEKTINVDNFQKGFYFCKISNKSGYTATLPLIIQ